MSTSLKPLCQIATVGRNPEWIKIGLFRYPTKKLVLITTKDYYSKAEEVNDIAIGIDVEIKVIEKPRDSNYIVLFLKDLINHYHKKYDIRLNVTSGLVSWQLLFYNTATILQDKLKSFYIIDKEEKEPLELLLYSPLTKTQKKILMIIPLEQTDLQTITNRYQIVQKKAGKEEDQGTKGLLSRYIKQLINEGLVEFYGTGKNKKFGLSKKGQLLQLLLKE